MEKSSVYQTTKAGLEKLKEELKYREDTLRYEIANTLNEMRNQGDLRENDGYSMAIEEQHINEGRIAEIKEKIKNAKIVKEILPEDSKNVIDFFSAIRKLSDTGFQPKKFSEIWEKFNMEDITDYKVEIPQ